MREQLRLLIHENETWLMRRVCDYAIERGYSRYTATQEQAWRMSIAGLSDAMARTLERDLDLELSPEEDYEQDPAATFGIMEAARHRERGVAMPMFLGLFKYYRQSYVDLIELTQWPVEQVRRACLWLHRFFDRVELGFCSEWADKNNAELIRELQSSNIQVTNEKNQFLTIFESLACPVALCDDGSGEVRMNRAWIGLFGDGDSISWLHDDLQAFVDAEEDRMEIRKTATVLGEVRMFSAALSRMRDISEKFCGSLIVLKDITVQQDYENALKMEKELAENYLNVASVIMLALDDSGCTSLINKKGCEVLGYTSEEMLGKNWFDHFVPKRERAAVKNVFATIMADRLELVQYHENSIIRSDGTECIIAWHNSVLRDAQGRVTGTISSGEDITEKKKLEKELKRNEKQFRLAFENAGDAIFWADAETGTIIKANHAAETLMDMPRERLIGMSQSALHPEDVREALVEMFRTHIQKGGAAADTAVILTSAGKRVPVHITASLTDIGGRTIIQGIFRDITAMLELQNQLECRIEEFNMIFENSGDAILWAEAETGTIIKVNREAEMLIGKSREELIGTDIKEWHAPARRQQIQELLHTHTMQAGSIHGETELLSTMGIHVPVYFTTSVTRIGGNVIMQGTYRDLTEREKQRRVLEAERNKTQTLLENTPAFIALLDQDLHITYANKNFVNLFGNPENQTCYRVMAGRETPCDDCSLCVDADVPGQGIKEWTDSLGRTFFIHETTITDTDGQTYALKSGIDITQIKAAHKKQEQQNLFLNTLLETIPAPVFYKNRAGCYMGCNQAFEAYVGLSRQDIIGKTVFDIWGQNFGAAYQEADDDLYLTTVPQGYEFILAHSDGSLRDVMYHNNVFSDPDGSVGGLLGVILDITDRKKAEQALAESEERIRSLIENVPIGIFRNTPGPDGVFVMANPAVARMHGFDSPEQLLGMRVADLYAIPEDRAELSEIMARDGFVQNHEILLRRRNGDLFCASVTIRVVCDEDGAVRCFDGTIQDVTERKRLEDEVRQSESRLKDFLDNASDIIQMVDSSGRFLFVNRAWYNTFGYSAEDLLDLNVFDILHPDNAQQCKDVFSQVFQGQDIPEVETAFISKSGRKIILEGSVNCRYENGVPVSTRAIFRDVSERRQAEERIRESESRLRAVTDAANDAIIMIDPQGLVSFWNPAAEMILGWSAGEIIGKDLHSLLAPEQFHASIAKGFAHFQRTGQGAAVGNTLELTAIHKSGRHLPIDISLAAKQLSDGTWGAVGIIRDITERKTAQEKLRQAMTELEKSNHELEEFAYVASHDLKEPLRMVVSYMQLLQRRYQGKLDEKGDKYIQYAVDGANRMQILITALLEYSRIGRKDSDLQSMDCNALMEQIERDLQIATQDVNGRITHDPLPTVTVSPTLFGRLLMNLSGNGLKYCNGKAPHVHVSAEKLQGEWVFSIRDNGIGIAPEHHERIFKIFHRLHTRGEYQGTGIGLAVCKKVVEFHGGRIWVESEPGAGSTFRFTLPEIIPQGVAS